MKTEPLFYELFRLYPSSLSELTGLDVQGDYVFESITVKSTERRLDGFFRRTDGDGPDIFLEVQGYDDPNIYWRLFQEIFTYYAQADRKKPFTAVILFTDKKYDPEDCPVSGFLPPNRLKTTMQSAKFKVQNDCGVFIHFTFCILHCFKKSFPNLFRNGKLRLTR